MWQRARWFTAWSGAWWGADGDTPTPVTRKPFGALDASRVQVVFTDASSRGLLALASTAPALAVLDQSTRHVAWQDASRRALGITDASVRVATLTDETLMWSATDASARAVGLLDDTARTPRMIDASGARRITDASTPRLTLTH